MSMDIRPPGIMLSVTGDDSNDIALPDTIKAQLGGVELKGFLVNTAGTATVIDMANQQHASFPLQAGYNPIRLKRIFSTSLNASGIWALYW